MTTGTDATMARGRWMWLLLSYVLFAIAIGSATQPWWTGVYTWVEQQRLLRVIEHTAAPETTLTQRQAPSVQADPWAGWLQEDAAYWSHLKRGASIGRLTIPRLDLDMAVIKGAAPDQLKKGPGWITSTSMPGPTGNFTVSGHRTTYLAPFRHIERLSSGDLIVVTSPWRVYTYRVFKSIVVRPKDTWVAKATPRPIITLTACHPAYSARKRYVVQGVLESVRPLTQSTPNALP